MNISVSLTPSPTTICSLAISSWHIIYLPSIISLYFSRFSIGICKAIERIFRQISGALMTVSKRKRSKRGVETYLFYTNQLAQIPTFPVLQTGIFTLCEYQ